MRSYAGFSLVGLAALGLTGCPIYPDNSSCFEDLDCPTDYYCGVDSVCVQRPSYGTAGSGGSVNTNGKHCQYPEQCTQESANSVCGADGLCHTGDCFFWKCVEGYACVLAESGYYECESTTPRSDAGVSDSAKNDGPNNSDAVADSAAQDTSKADSSTDDADGGLGADADSSTSEASTQVYCGNPSDCPDNYVCTASGVCVLGSCDKLGCVSGYVCSGEPPACVPSNPAACILDSACAPLGVDFKCVNGLCTGPEQLCTDKTQCPGGALDQAKCVDGKCVKTCTPDAATQCAYGFVCDASLSICLPPKEGCTITDDCESMMLVCIQGACVPRCLPGGQCEAGLVCVANGCVPDQTPAFDCSVDGQQDECASTSICLHHHCYLSCQEPNPTACDANPPGLNLCKTVTTASGEHKICGSSTTLGSECDPSLGVMCEGAKICVDGYCL